MSGALLTFELLLRGGTLAAVIISLVGLAARWREAGPGSAMLLGFGLAAYVLVSSPATAPPAIAAVPLIIVASANPAFLWWAGMEVFEDGGRFRRLAPGLIGVTAVLGLATLHWPGAAVPRGVLAGALYLHLLWTVLAGRRGDLVDARRRWRPVAVGAAAATGVAVTVVEMAGAVPLPGVLAAQAAVLAAYAVLFAVFAVPRADMLWPRRAVRNPAAPAPSNARERALIGRLDAAMTAGIWRREGLTIGALAAELGTPEHQLRAAINGALGYRNFAAYVNDARIDAAAVALRDPEQAAQSVTQIAYGVGFSSLGPFNRAFRERIGETPTAYRERVSGRS